MGAVPFAGWLLAGRVEFVVLALAIPLLLIPLTAHLPVVRQRRLVHWVTLLLILRFAVLPFLAPAFEVRRQSALHTFIDEDGVRWIVDYKTGTHEGGNVSGFLDKEEERYSSQLEGYAAALRILEDRVVKTALYYPLIEGGWRECG